MKSSLLTVLLLAIYAISLNAQTVEPRLEVEGLGTDDDVIRLSNNNHSRIANYGASFIPSAIPSFIGFKSRGTYNSPEILFPGDRITGIFGASFIDGQYRVAAAVEMYAGDVVNTSSASSYLVFGTTNENSLVRSEKMRIDSEGDVGIGTNDPASKLEVSGGDVYIEDISSGVIMKSPNGNCWRYQPANTGELIGVQIACPN